MILGPEDPIEVEPGTPIAEAVTRGREAFARGDAASGEVAFREAVELAAAEDDPRLWSALAVDHVAGLLSLENVTAALAVCDAYLREVPATHVSLRILRAQIRLSIGDHPGVDAELIAVRAILDAGPDPPTAYETAVLRRLGGLRAAERGRLDEADRALRDARRILLAAGHSRGVATIDRDRLMLAVRRGDEPAVDTVASGWSPKTVSDFLLRSQALKRQLRYEEAFFVLFKRAIEGEIDPALRFPVLCELAVLLRIIANEEAATRLLPLLEEAAAASPDPVTSAAAIARIYDLDTAGGEVSPAFDRRLQHARRLIAQVERMLAEGARLPAKVQRPLGEAEQIMVELRPSARTDRDIAMWCLAAGELALARSRFPQTRSFAHDAITHLSEAVTHAKTTPLLEIRARALRLLGRACIRQGLDDRAASSWAEAHRLEEHIAQRQLTDETRVRMLHAVPDEHDERVRAAAEALEERGDEVATAALVVAMEAARGAAILARILPGNAALARDLPSPSDARGSWRWVQRMARGLPRAQVVWLMHPAPDRVYHAVIGRSCVMRACGPPLPREKVTEAIDALAACWEYEKVLESSSGRGEFDQCLAEVASRIGIDKVLLDLPQDARRIAIVAGGVLADIPFAAIMDPTSAQPIGSRFALSDLPCLSARAPLRRRARHVRGDRRLVVRPPADDLTMTSGPHISKALENGQATRAALRDALGLHRYHQVRIDSHGRHDPAQPTRSWLRLASDGHDGLDGRLHADELQSMDLGGCGMLTLGACESGMAQRTGRDERTGFVRAAFHAGAASVLAARWVAADPAAAAVLDNFDRYLRYLPRDVALQRAQLGSHLTDLPAADHPARWACWTLYGDSGLQTSAGALRRWLRRAADDRRWHAGSR